MEGEEEPKSVEQTSLAEVVHEETKAEEEKAEEETKEKTEEEEKEETIWKRLDELFAEYHLSNFHVFAVKRFIKDKIGDPTATTVERVRQWLFNKLNKKRLLEITPG